MRGKLVACVVLVAAAARAEPAPADSALARSLFEDARTEMAQNDYAAACPKLEYALRILPDASGTKFNLAVCYEKSGRVASAWGLYLDVANTERLAGHPDREHAARSSAEAVASRVPHLVVRLERDDAAIVVQRDGAAVDRDLFGTAVPIDPGAHVIEARAPSRRPWRETVNAVEGRTVTVVIPALEAEVLVTNTRRRPLSPVVLTLGGGGLAWLAAGAVFVGLSVAEYSESNDTCSSTTNGCTTLHGVTLRDQSILHGDIATMGFALGIASLAAAIVVALLPAPRHHKIGLAPHGLGVTW